MAAKFAPALQFDSVEYVQVVLLDRKEPLLLPKQKNNESLGRLAARQGLGVRPSALELFGIKNGNLWLSPADPLPTNDQPLELRLRFKTPTPGRLRLRDQAAFEYYYVQVRKDFDSSLVLKDTHKDLIKEINSHNPKWYTPVISIKKDQESARLKAKRISLLSGIVLMVSLNVVIDILTFDKEKKEIMKNFDAYLPNGMWASKGEKLMGMSKMQQMCSAKIDLILTETKKSVKQRKEEFLDHVEKHFPKYFEEIYNNVEYRSMASEIMDVVKNITLKIVPPFAKSGQYEIEPYLAIIKNPSEPQEKLCEIEEICNISVNNTSERTQIEIARKNGIPLYLTIQETSVAMAFLTNLSGYYRLCEKWIYSLCSELEFPNLNHLLKSQVHGPVDFQFVRDKFKAEPGRQQVGTYLIRQSCDNHFTYFLHYMSEVGEKIIYILQSKETGTFSIDKSTIKDVDLSQIQEVYSEISQLIKDLRGPLQLKTCLHPSELDKAQTLLLCRSPSKVNADIVGVTSWSNNHEHRYFINLSALKKYENIKLKGRLTNVWKGEWTKNSQETLEVAMKQLKQDSHLLPFSQMCYNAMIWDDPTLVRVYGATLAIPRNPMTLIMEYLPIGKLNTYLKENRDNVTKEELLEAATALARALWYLDEHGIVHSNIRLGNVFVSEHKPGACFKVKLGDPGLPDYNNPKEVHWMSFELLLDSCPTPSKCTSKGDVWAFATTLWELFSYGEFPSLDPVFAKEQYISGNRLQKPSTLEGNLASIYMIMMRCWMPFPEARDTPQAILRDLNQLLYRVFNAKKIHTYISVDDTTSEQSGSLGTLQTTAGSDDTVVYLSSNAASEAGNRPPEVPPPRKNSYESSQGSLQNFGNFSPPSGNSLVPAFNDLMKKLLKNQGDNDWISESQQNLLGSRSGSSMDGSLVNSYMSQFTTHTSLSSLSSCTYSMPSVYQLDEGKISWNKERPIGEGNFGIVFHGVLTHSDGEWEEVAVKLLKEVNDQGAEEEIRHELMLMRDLVHENIVQIKGCHEILNEGMIAIVMEYVREGSLDNYLRTYKNRIKMPQLFLYAENICEGMIYLSKRGIIHRDLAARNILVANEEQVKISDFGLARIKEDNKDYYMQTSNTNIPVRWMAIESLYERRYTQFTDVWSFGVVLWEMFSFGEIPYLEGCEQFFIGERNKNHQMITQDLQTWIKRLDDNGRFPKPEGCPDTLYSLMLACWEKIPEDRPTFTHLKEELKTTEMKVT